MKTFTTPLKEPFDSVYMRELFRVGYDLGRTGYPWAKVPPGWTTPELEPPVAVPGPLRRQAATK